MFSLYHQLNERKAWSYPYLLPSSHRLHLLHLFPLSANCKLFLSCSTFTLLSTCYFFLCCFFFFFFSCVDILRTVTLWKTQLRFLLQFMTQYITFINTFHSQTFPID